MATKTHTNIIVAKTLNPKIKTPGVRYGTAPPAILSAINPPYTKAAPCFAKASKWVITLPTF